MGIWEGACVHLLVVVVAVHAMHMYPRHVHVLVAFVAVHPMHMYRMHVHVVVVVGRSSYEQIHLYYSTAARDGDARERRNMTTSTHYSTQCHN
mgnify:CR=1 FL=1